MAIGEEQFRVTMKLPEAPQGVEGSFRQRNEAIAVAFGIANMHPLTRRIDVANLQRQPLAKAQTQAVQGEVEHPIAQRAGRGKQALCFVDRDDVGQSLRLRRLDQIGHRPRLAQHVGGVELQAVEVELHSAPRVGLDQVAEILGQLCFGEIVDPVAKVLAQPPDGPAVGVYGLGLQALELQMLEVSLVLPVKVVSGAGRHAGLSSRNIAESSPGDQEMGLQDTSWRRRARLLRVAASSNKSFQRTAFGSR